MAADFLERMGQRIRERRDSLELSRAEVARRMPGKVNENQVYRWEKGLHQPNPDTLEALAAVLEVDVGYFMAPPEPAKMEETPEPFAANGELTQLDRIELELAAIRQALSEAEEPSWKQPFEDLLAQVRALVESPRSPGKDPPESHEEAS